MNRNNSFKDLEAYGIIGNLETCALIGNDGSIDWLCFPELGSASVCAALLDTDKGGYFRISPVDKYESFQSYVGKTNVLTTCFKTAFGTLEVTDFMPVIKNKNSGTQRAVFRKVRSLYGPLRVEIKFCPRFHYAQDMPVFRPARHGVAAEYAQEKLFLQSPVPLTVNKAEAGAVWELQKNRSAWFVLQ